MSINKYVARFLQNVDAQQFWEFTTCKSIRIATCKNICPQVIYKHIPQTYIYIDIYA